MRFCDYLARFHSSMYPNLYYVFKDWFGVEWQWAKVLNTFGLMVAISFAAASYILSIELRRKEKQGLLKHREEVIIVGKSPSPVTLFMNFVLGFLFGYKIIGLIFFRPAEVNPQEYLFSSAGNVLAGIVTGLIIAGIKWNSLNKQKLAQPERRTVRIWPHDRVGDIVVVALVAGIIGAKLFDGIEHWETFSANPVAYLTSSGGLAFYGGLIVAGIAVSLYARSKGIKLPHLVDAVAPGLMIAYAIGRIGCQLAGDGDWGIYNSAYYNDAFGNVAVADPSSFTSRIAADSAYFLKGQALNEQGQASMVTDRTYESLQEVPHKPFQGPSFLPKWMFAYAYPQNVNNDGKVIPGIKDEHNRVLPSPVFPTPFYETLIGLIFFGILWSIRRRIHTPLVLFGIYLVLNGIERFFIEKIRVNKLYDVLGFRLSQAEIIALVLIALGVLTVVLARYFYGRRRSMPTT